MLAKRFLVLLVVALMAGAVLVAYAGNVHFVGSLSFTSNSPLNASGIIAGLGNSDVTVTMDATATVIASCQNKGGKIAPGRNPISVMVTTSTIAVADTNGRAPLSLTAGDPTTFSPPPVSPNPKDAGCPNGNNWIVTGLVPDSTHWTGAVISIFDNANGALLLQASFTCTGQGAALSCTEV